MVDRGGTNSQLFSSNGTYFRSDMLTITERESEKPRGGEMRVALFGDGSYLIEQSLLSFLKIEQLGNGEIRVAQREGSYDDSTSFRRITPRGDVVADFGSVVTERSETITLRSGDKQKVSLFPEFFWAVHGERFLIGDAAESQLSFYSANGSLTTIVRLPIERLKLDRVMFAGVATGDSPSPEEQRIRNEFSDAMKNIRLPSFLPSFSWIVVDKAGDIWLRPFIPRDIGEATRSIRTWWVLDPRGVLRGVVTVPEGFLAPEHFDVTRMEFGADYILAVWRDKNDVQEVQVYGLRRR